MANLSHVTSDTQIVATTVRGAFVHSVTVSGGAAAAGTLVVKAGGSSGTTLLTLGAGIGDTTQWRAASPAGVWFAGGVYADVGGAGAAAMVEWSD